jgi:hypothetical protein
MSRKYNTHSFKHREFLQLQCFLFFGVTFFTSAAGFLGKQAHFVRKTIIWQACTTDFESRRIIIRATKFLFCYTYKLAILTYFGQDWDYVLVFEVTTTIPGEKTFKQPADQKFIFPRNIVSKRK